MEQRAVVSEAVASPSIASRCRAWSLTRKQYANHKIRDTEGIYDKYDYFAERREALARWATLLAATSQGTPPAEWASRER